MLHELCNDLEQKWFRMLNPTTRAGYIYNHRKRNDLQKQPGCTQHLHFGSLQPLVGGVSAAVKLIVLCCESYSL
jgi:hypothetical protein